MGRPRLCAVCASATGCPGSAPGGPCVFGTPNTPCVLPHPNPSPGMQGCALWPCRSGAYTGSLWRVRGTPSPHPRSPGAMEPPPPAPADSSRLLAAGPGGPSQPTLRQPHTGLTGGLCPGAGGAGFAPATGRSGAKPGLLGAGGGLEAGASSVPPRYHGNGGGAAAGGRRLRRHRGTRPPGAPPRRPRQRPRARSGAHGRRRGRGSVSVRACALPARRGGREGGARPPSSFWG